MNRTYLAMRRAAQENEATRESVMAAAMRVRNTTRYHAERLPDAALASNLLWKGPDKGPATRIGTTRFI